MDITPHEQEQRPWRVLGTDGHTKISVAPPCSVRVQVGDVVAVVPMDVALALQTDEAKAFLKDPAVAPFLYAGSERESRIRAARLLASKKLSKLRREFVDALVQANLASESEAWTLASLKYPIDL